MTATQLLDSITEAFKNLPKDAKVSEFMNANLELSRLLKMHFYLNMKGVVSIQLKRSNNSKLRNLKEKINMNELFSPSEAELINN